MKFLRSIATLPYPSTQGHIVVQPGHNPHTGILLDLPHDYLPGIPTAPSPEQVRLALVRMMAPWRGYRFATPDDAAGMVAAVLAAIARPSLDLCPLIVFDAAVQGSGKTKAASSLGALILGTHPAVTPFSASTSEDEIKKLLFSLALEKAPFSCLDNLRGRFDSSTYAAALTSGQLHDRVLGQSRQTSARLPALLTATANNLDLGADIQRRASVIRIDAGENPTHRDFAFCPVREAAASRLDIAEAACTIWQAYFNAGSPQMKAGDAGGFADWNRLCRQPVLWLAAEGLASDLPWPDLGDPAASMLVDASLTDTELEAQSLIWRCLWILSEQQDFTSADVRMWFMQGEREPDGPMHDLRAALQDLIGTRDLSAISIGKALFNRRERTAGGFKLLCRGISSQRRWRVVAVGQ